MSEPEPLEEKVEKPSEKSAKAETPAKPAKKVVKARLRMIYNVDTGKRTISLRNRKCIRCGAIMAYHAKPVERWTCGSCSYTDFSKKD